MKYFVKHTHEILIYNSYIYNIMMVDYNKDIHQKDPAAAAGRNRLKSKYDLSDSYTLLTDTNAYQRDTAYFNTLRPIPLTPHEQTLYEDFFLRRDTLLYKKKPKNKRLEFWGQIGDALVSRYTVDFAKMGSVRCSPLINPLLLSYSGSNGFSYRQEFKYNRLFTGASSLSWVIISNGRSFIGRSIPISIIGPASVPPCMSVWVMVTVFTVVMCWRI